MAGLVQLKMSDDSVRRVLFPLDDPAAFKAALDGALAKYRERVVPVE